MTSTNKAQVDEILDNNAIELVDYYNAEGKVIGKVTKVKAETKEALYLALEEQIIGNSISLHDNLDHNIFTMIVNQNHLKDELRQKLAQFFGKPPTSIASKGKK